VTIGDDLVTILAAILPALSSLFEALGQIVRSVRGDG
jgi:hypothetical protein